MEIQFYSSNYEKNLKEHSYAYFNEFFYHLMMAPEFKHSIVGYLVMSWHILVIYWHLRRVGLVKVKRKFQICLKNNDGFILRNVSRHK